MIKGKRNLLFFFGSFIVLITTAILLTIIPYFDLKIAELNDEYENLTEQVKIAEFNFVMSSDQLLKLSNTYAHYYILRDINSTKAEEQDKKLKSQFAYLINIFSQGGIDFKTLLKMDTDALQKTFFEEEKKYSKNINDIIEKRNKLGKELFKLNRLRGYFLIGVGILQSLGLLIVFISSSSFKKQ